VEENFKINDNELSEVVGGKRAPDGANPQLSAPRGYNQHCEQYIIQEGDTLSGIAQKFGVSWRLLKRINAIPDADRIFAGQYLWVPYDKVEI